MTRPFPTIHACALRIGEAGLLIRGASRSGKSSLTLALIEEAKAQGRPARLVADDRFGLRHEEGALYAQPHPAIAGQIEKRGFGILTLPHEPRVRLTHVIDLTDQSPPKELVERGGYAVDGVTLTRFELPAGEPPGPAAQAVLAKI